jgi:hypothetical protein
MYDHATLTLLAKLKMLAKKMGINVDLMKIGEDKEYTADVLSQLSNSDDQELVMIVINLMNQFGLIKAPKTVAAGATEDSTKERYVGKLR